jgi:cytochrome c5
MSTPPPSSRIVPQYLIGVVVAAIVVGLVGMLLFPPLRAKSSAELSADAVAARLAPVARVEVAGGGGAARVLKTGDAVYAGLCVACHGAGIAGAPKLGDKKAWGPRIAQGFDTLVKHATEGYKGMPPKGGGTDLDAQEVARAVAWMADQGGASFKEP